MSVFLNNVDDYLGPSQACVNPLFTAPSKSTSTAANANSNATLDKTEVTLQTDSAGVVPKRRIRRRAAPRIQAEEDSQRREPIRLLHSTDDGFAASEVPSVDIDPPSTKTKVKATVTLSDCLSCSGCVTSAEAVLMSHHSVDKFREVSSKGDKQIVFTISSAALADLYRYIYACNQSVDDNVMADRNELKQSILSRHEFLQCTARFLHSEFGVVLLVDGAVTQRISLLESAHEFCYRYKQKHQIQQMSDEPEYDVTSVALSSTQTRYIKKKTGSAPETDRMEVSVVNHPPGLSLEGDDDSMPTGNNIQNLHNQSLPLPMLASSCPGFVCLVEKTAAPVVPLLSTAKSPMAVAGALLKSGMFGAYGTSDTSNRQSFHVAVMPCHDKKLEAGRNDFAWEKQTLLKYAGETTTEINSSNEIVNEVDLVLTTGELLELLTSAADKVACGTSIRELLGTYISKSVESTCLLISDTDTNQTNSSKDTHSMQSSNAAELDVGVHGSGSYADFIFRFAAMELFGCDLSQTQTLPWASPSNSSVGAAEQSSGGIRRRRRQDTTDLRSITLFQHTDGSYSCDGRGQSTPVLSFATAYGFKNVQLILQSLSNDGYTAGALDAKEYDYVEVMACPSGCPNGGGQIGSMGKRETPRDTKERVKATMSLMPLFHSTVGNMTVASSLYAVSDDEMSTNDGCNGLVSSLKDGSFGQSARRLLHTRFHAVPKLELSTGATAGVAVSDTKW
ncbi:hypothetical protein ACHAXN_011523 [Cyclotella atomus]|jgi:iron only hydrogenase large subunit-like protein